MKRIVVIGTTGCGKTTLAHALADKIGGTAVDLDDLSWLPGWVEQSNDVFLDLAEKSTPAEGKWVIAGNYSRTRPAVWPKADTLIWLDYSFSRVLYQLLRRTYDRIVTQKKICNGNTESLKKALSKDSIIIWFFKTYHKKREAYRELFQDPGRYPHMTYIRLGSPAETAHFLKHVKSKGS